MKAMIALVVMGSCLVVGCGKKADEGPKPAAESTGVVECDDYLKQIDQCIVTAPAQKATMEQSKAQMAVVFKAMASAPGGKEKLKADCADHIKRLAATCGK